MGRSLLALKEEMHRWIIQLTKNGEFKNQQAARTVFVFYCQHIIANDDEERGLYSDYVLPGVVSPIVVANSTGLNEKTIRKANEWLENRHLIELKYCQGKKYRYVKWIKISGKPELEDLRQLKMSNDESDSNRA